MWNKEERGSFSRILPLFECVLFFDSYACLLIALAIQVYTVSWLI
ncbi:hypothetical protein X975_06834, partial [Stegodyphus mimosarum]